MQNNAAKNREKKIVTNVIKKCKEKLISEQKNKTIVHKNGKVTK